MHKSKLFELLHTLEKQEWKDLKKHLESCIEKRSEVYQFFLRIEKHKADLTHKNLSIDLQHRKYYPKLERKTVLNLLSKLAQHVEHFLTLTEINRDKNILDLYKAKAFNRRGLHDKANQLANKMRERLTDPTHLNLWHPWYLTSLNHTLFFSYNPVKNTPEGPALLKNCISTTLKLQEYMLPFYACEAINRESIHKEDWSKVKSQLTLKVNKENNEDKLSYCLYHFRHLTERNNQQNYKKLYDTFFDDALNIDQGIAIPIFIRLRMHLEKNAILGNNSTILQLSNLYYFGIKSGKCLYNEKIHPNSFITAISSLSANKEWEKANEILELGKEILPKNDFLQAHSIAKMTVLLRMNETNALVKIFHETKFGQIEYKTMATPLLLRAFYQDLEDDTEFIDTQIRNFQEMLRRHSAHLSEKKMVGQNNFIKILKAMIHEKDRKMIRHKLERMNSVFYRTWIVDQLEKEGQH